MAFDSGMVKCICLELDRRFRGGKVEKVLQPEKDEINLVIRAEGKSDRLLLSASANNPRIGVTGIIKENPENAYMLCMLLRKHLTGAKVESVEQLGFERVVRILFDTGDELGYRRQRSLYLEIMGRSSTLVFCDERDKILATTRLVDLTANASRKLLPGLIYELPPSQGKQDPFSLTEERFDHLWEQACGELSLSRWIVDSFTGFSPLVGREIAYQACGDFDALVGSCNSASVKSVFFSLIKRMEDGHFSPCVLYKDPQYTSAFEFSYFPIAQYQEAAFVKCYPSASEALDSYYVLRDRAERKKTHYNDIFTILKNGLNRVKKKIGAQSSELADCERAEELKNMGDLIMQELYRIRKGEDSVVVTDYSTEPFTEKRIPLNPRLTPVANAQKYYKDYAKKNTAKLRIAEQLVLAYEEQKYLESVWESLERAVTEADFSQIRTELSRSGYGKRGVAIKAPDKRKKAKPDELTSPNGFRVYVGRNNTQNDWISFDLAEKDDVWFHVKDYPGAHVLLVTGGEAPPNADLEFCARIAAGASGGGTGDKVAVDYTLARYVKKPSGAKPGLVNYFKYTTVYVSPLKIEK